MEFDENPNAVALGNKIKKSSRDIFVVTGAGISAAYGAPSWKALIESVEEKCEQYLSGLTGDEAKIKRGELTAIKRENDYWRRMDAIKRFLPKDIYIRIISQSLSYEDGPIELDSSDRYEKIFSLNVGGVINFNLDGVSESGYWKVNGKPPRVASWGDEARARKAIQDNKDLIYYAHGSVEEDESWVLSQLDRNNWLRSASLDFIETIFSTKSTLIIGFNPDDSAFRFIIDCVRRKGKVEGGHYILLDNPSQSLEEEYSELGFSIIRYINTGGIHLQVDRFLGFLNDFDPDERVKGSVFVPSSDDEYRKVFRDMCEECQDLNLLRLELNAKAGEILDCSDCEEDENKNLIEFIQNNDVKVHNAWHVTDKGRCRHILQYRVEECLGKGSFGTVYKAYDEINERVVALKVLLKEVVEDSLCFSAFKRGVQSMKILTENRVEGMVDIYGAIEVPSTIVMECIDGVTLYDFIQRGCVDTRDVFYILLEVSEIVHSGHSLKECVLHRDLKPDNVMLRDYYSDPDNIDVVLLDFDLSWYRGAQEFSVIQGAASQGYAAPEQTAAGRKLEGTTKSTLVDSFGFGMVVYYCLTGDHPRPNNQNFTEFSDVLLDGINKNHFSLSVACKNFLIEIVIGATKDNQAERIPFTQIMEGLRSVYDVIDRDVYQALGPLFLREAAYSIYDESYVTFDDENMEATIVSPDSSISANLKLVEKKSNVVCYLDFTKSRVGYESRGAIGPKLNMLKDNAATMLTDRGWFDVGGSVQRSAFQVKAQLIFEKEVDKIFVRDFSTKLAEVFSAINL